MVLIMTVGLQISLFFVGVELFTDFYSETAHAASVCYLYCGLASIGIWIEKGMGFVLPGFIPTPLGEVFEYSPTAAHAAA